ncbi:multi-sensor hybrid histidine kinase [Enhygromyxa salina]|uniref:histidine kinase n=1 Tax=Enhygromyxa salina TaxID=215803 RepID=A0A0C2CX00_9BACT|nr:multi-sensor hybrid histidine kinase [Enhygromyxa salina]
MDRVEFRIGSGPWERDDAFTRAFALRSGGHDHGGLRVHCEDPTPFLPYVPYIENLAAMLGVILEERRQRELNASHQRELEARVEERTRQLRDEVRDRHAAETQALWEKARAERYLEMAEAIVVELDVQGRIALINKQGCTLLGRTEQELVGADWFSIALPPEARDPVRQVFHEMIAGTTTQAEYYENEIVNHRGERRYVTWHNATRHDDNGVPIGTLSSGRDLTERRLFEERRVQSQKMEAMGTLAGGIAHDFNNLLSAVLGYTELSLMDFGQTQELQTYLQEVLLAANRAKGLVKQILTFSRRSKREVQPVLISELVRETLGMLRSSLPATVTITPTLRATSAVLSDPTEIHQVLMNLCTNAGLAMEHSGGVLGIELDDVDVGPELVIEHPELAIGPHVRLSVSDTGCGIPSHLLERILEPFFTTREGDAGTGMGLSVVHGIVRSCGGALTVHSEVGVGTTFDVYFPAQRQAAARAEQIQGEIPLGTERILFVDDEDYQVALAEETLGRLGYRVRITTSSLQALEIFQLDPEAFDLVITDMTMPGMTGDRLASRLLEIRPGLPIILCTGYDGRLDEPSALALGIRGYALKPIPMVRLATMIRAVLAESGPTRL